jgi:hypothetical protein
MRRKRTILAVLGLFALAFVGLLPAIVGACPTAQLQTQCLQSAPLATIGYAAPVAQFVAPAPSYYVQQQAFVAPPQPVVAAYSQTVVAQPFVAGYTQQYATGGAVALRGRFAGAPAVGAAQLNLGAGVSRERVLRPTLFKRKVGQVVAPVGAAPLVLPY